MRKVTRKRFIAVISYLVAINLSFAPMAHASLTLFDGSVNQSVETSNNCDQSSTDLKEDSTYQHKDHVKGGMMMDCENGATCEILCSVSVSVLHQGNISIAGYGQLNRWFTIYTPTLKSSFLSRLERPPRP
jgi:hypothetical protein